MAIQLDQYTTTQRIMISCSVCNELMTREKYSLIKSIAKHGAFICRKCCIKPKQNIDYYRKLCRDRHTRVRSEIIQIYGNMCVCCKITKHEFLGIDHILKNGAEHRKNGIHGNMIYHWLKKNNCPTDDYRLLCHNCNLAIGAYGLCPHHGRIDGPEAYGGKKLRGKRRARKLKLEIVNAYGGECKCCGETQPYFLTIDHINGGGKKHRATVGYGQKFYTWLKHNNYPLDEFRLLCMNCNLAIGAYGSCNCRGLLL